MNARTRKQIEWHFYNYEADKALYAEKEQDIIHSNMCANLDYAGGCSRRGSPAESKAIKLLELDNRRDWAAVVRNVMVAFEFEVQGDIIKDKFNPDYEKRLRYRELVTRYGNGNESVYTYRYNKIIDLAAEWAIKFNLISYRDYPLNFRR